jgi:hypothetical protein
VCPGVERECTYYCIDIDFVPHNEWCPEGTSCTALGCAR